MSPDAPDESLLKDETEGAFGYAHSYETSSRYDGPGVRVVLFVSGCLLRCIYCHNPDTWHLKDGTYVSTQQILDRLSGFASALLRVAVFASRQFAMLPLMPEKGATLKAPQDSKIKVFSAGYVEFMRTAQRVKTTCR
jgi:pyruvate-formate lyase-activating enzyme